MATGLRLQLRGATRGDAADLRVADVDEVELPPGPAFEALDVRGAVWRRLWLAPDRMVVEFIGLAIAEVRSDGRIVFDRELAPDLEQHLILDHLLALELARRGRMVLHGAVLSRDQRAVVLTGQSGAGKSTLTAFAWQRGWTVGGDDGAVVHIGSRVEVEPTYPTIRLLPTAAALLGMPTDTGEEAVGKRRLTDAGAPLPFRQDPLPLHLVAGVHPVPAEQEAELVILEGVDAHAALFGCAFHLEHRGGTHMRDIVDRLALVTESTRIARIAVPRGLDGLAAAERLLRQAVDR